MQSIISTLSQLYHTYLARCSNKSIAEILTPSISSPNDTATKVHATQSSFTNGNVDDIILERKITLADNSVNEKSLQTILQERIKTVNPTTGQRLRYNDLLKARVDIDFVIHLERKMIVILFQTKFSTFLKLQSDNQYMMGMKRPSHRLNAF